MSKHKDSDGWTFECDNCPEVHMSAEPDFHDAWAEAREEGWRAIKVKDEWQHICPDCQERL